ncbi:hypothetical protein BXY66_0333 [Shimia isoporae]|uniref:ApeI dehydratase-like domain-containing protein n=1 Tax=Shimia isoporae TaxID=647720 RepID=A0A4R1NSR0_9RHOB|nr:hypothetical protein BXY66_0333 [Shimia isoporae]
MHREVFILRAEEATDRETKMVLDASHPIFREHFPDFPVVPGSMTVEMILRCFRSSTQRDVHLVYASFLHPVRPVEEPIVLKSSCRSHEIRFALTQGQKPVCRGALIIED